MQQELGNLTTQAQETFSAIRVIKAYAREAYFTEKMQEKNEVYKKTALKLATIESFFGPAMDIMIGLSVLIIVISLFHFKSTPDFRSGMCKFCRSVNS